MIIKWIAPLEPFIKLNTGGNSLDNPGLAGAGGLLQNGLRSWVLGFSLNMDIALNNIAELETVRWGLILACNLGFKFIHLEIDSMTVLSWLTTNNDISLDAIPQIFNCRTLMEHD